MERNKLVRLMVLNEICDDYENIDQIILPHLARQCAKLGFAVERSDIVRALAELVADGLAKAYRLSSTAPVKELQGMPQLDAVDEDFEIYFYITDKGMVLQLSDDQEWPFDDEGNPRS